MNSPSRFLIPTIALAALLAAASGAPAGAIASPFATEDAASGRSELYRQGQRALAEKRWSDAIELFGELAREPGPETDAAVYWQAYAAAKGGRKAEALAGIRRLLAEFPASAWADDAAALELTLREASHIEREAARIEREAERMARDAERQAEQLAREGDRLAREGERMAREAGRAARDVARVAPLDEGEELKLYALDGLLQVDPERAVPVLERFLSGEHSLRLKERALFVLSQSDSPRARQILLDLARSGRPAELQLKAVQMFGIAGDEEDLAALAQLYRETGTPQIRSAILDAWMIAGAVDPVLAAARSETDPALRGRAIEMLGVMDAGSALAALWANEKDPALRARLLDAFALAGDTATLARAARGESDPALRHKAIQGLGLIDGEEAGRELLALYDSLPDPAGRMAVVDGLMLRDDASSLVSLFRKEQDPAVKRAIVQRLSLLDSEEATAELMRLLEAEP